MERLGNSARRLLAASGVPDPTPLSAIADLWPATVGSAIARVAWPRRLARDGTLHVATVSATWAFELSRLAPDILPRLAAAAGAGAPTALAFAIGPVPAPDADSPLASTYVGPEVSADDVSRAAEIAAGVEDADLRELITRAAAASLAAARVDHPFC